MTISRRKLLARLLRACFRAVCEAADHQADQSRMIVRSPRPEDLEMPLDGFTDFDHADRSILRPLSYLYAEGESERVEPEGGRHGGASHDADHGGFKEAPASGTGGCAGVRRQREKIL